MGAANNVPVPDLRPSPWWVRLSRWLNGARVCSVHNCIELTEPTEPYCTTHIRAFRTDLGDHACATPRCAEPREGSDRLCFFHREAALIDTDAAAFGSGRWNAPNARSRPDTSP
ncbi:MAG: hypothetical protein M0026_09815 [Nocardiopsaceae bacterium]|nr:hypothetical protein [Nocardiopsaceae bacterium]